jgi:hypothetical protein
MELSTVRRLRVCPFTIRYRSASYLRVPGRDGLNSQRVVYDHARERFLPVLYAPTDGRDTYAPRQLGQTASQVRTLAVASSCRTVGVHDDPLSSPRQAGMSTVLQVGGCVPRLLYSAAVRAWLGACERLITSRSRRCLRQRS